MKRFWSYTNFWKWIAIILLVIVWTLVNIHLKFYFFIIVMVVFCLLLLINARSSIVVVAIPLLFVILIYSQSPLAWLNLKTTNQRLFNNLRSSVNNLMMPKSGMEILPEKVFQIHALLDSYEIKSYRLTEAIRADPLIYQRTIESTWPITENPDSPYLFGFIGDIAHYGGCTVIEQRQDIELGTCR